MKQKAIILLEVLLAGLPIIKDDEKYVLSDDYCLCKECTELNSGKKVLVKVNFGNFTLANFIKWAESFSFDEVYLNGCNKVLNELKDKK